MSKTFFDKDEKTTASDLDWVWIGDPSTGTYKKIKKSNLLKEVIDGQQGGYFAYGTLGAAELDLDASNLSDKDSIKVTNDPAVNFDFSTTDVDTSNDTITETAHGLSDGDKVTFTTTGTLPAGLSAGTDYYVVSATADTFKVSTSISGSAVDITDQGSGTHTCDHENENGYYHVEGSSIVKDDVLPATTLDADDTSEPVSGKAVDDWILKKFKHKSQNYPYHGDLKRTLYTFDDLRCIKDVLITGGNSDDLFIISLVDRDNGGGSGGTHRVRISKVTPSGSNESEYVAEYSETFTDNGETDIIELSGFGGYNITAKILIDWSLAEDTSVTGNYQVSISETRSSPYDHTGLLPQVSDTIFKDRTQEIIEQDLKYKKQSYPFIEYTDGTYTYDELRAVKDVLIMGANPDSQFLLSLIRRDNGGGAGGEHLVRISRVGGSGGDTNEYVAAYSNTFFDNGITEVITLDEWSGSGITAKVLIDWSLCEDKYVTGNDHISVNEPQSSPYVKSGFLSEVVEGVKGAGGNTFDSINTDQINSKSGGDVEVGGASTGTDEVKTVGGEVWLFDENGNSKKIPAGAHFSGRATFTGTNTSVTVSIIGAASDDNYVAIPLGSNPEPISAAPSNGDVTFHRPSGGASDLQFMWIRIGA